MNFSINNVDFTYFKLKDEIQTSNFLDLSLEMNHGIDPTKHYCVFMCRADENGTMCDLHQRRCKTIVHQNVHFKVGITKKEYNKLQTELSEDVIGKFFYEKSSGIISFRSLMKLDTFNYMKTFLIKKYSI